MKINHTCKECKGKIILISVDKLGNTRCGYCNKIIKVEKTK
jgi:hypothetical protein